MKASDDEKRFMLPIYVLLGIMFLAFLAMGIDVASAQSQSTNNTQKVLLPSAARTATTQTADQINTGWKRAHVIINITAAPGGGETATLAINARDPASGSLYPILTGTALTTTGMSVYKVGPGFGAVANGAAADMVPQQWQVTVTHSSTGSWTYSVSAFLED